MSSMQSEHVLVTGGSGFIGFHLVNALAARGRQVTCLVRKPTGSTRYDRLEYWRLAELEKLGARIVFGDVTRPESFGNVLKSASEVYHLAGGLRTSRKATLYGVNRCGTECVVEACAQRSDPPVVVLISSLAAAGPSSNERSRVETDPAEPVSDYGRSKLAGELGARQYADRVPITVIRPPTVFGESDGQTLTMFQFVAHWGIHVVPTWRRFRYSLIHAADLTRAMVLAAERGRRLKPVGEPSAPGAESDAQGVYYVAAEDDPTFAELGRMIWRSLGRDRVRIVHIGPVLCWVGATAVELVSRVRRCQGFLNYDKLREIRSGAWTCTPRRAEEQLGFCVGAPLDERLRQTAQWFRKHGWL